MGLLELFLHSHLELLERTSHGTAQVSLRNRLSQLFFCLNARAAEMMHKLIDVTQLGLELVDPLALEDLLGQCRRHVIVAVLSTAAA
jgi:hypothetical protein